MRFVTTNGARIATEAFGSPDDPTLLLIMGATASMLGWPDALCTGLSGHGLHVIRFDHRDTGASTTVPPRDPVATWPKARLAPSTDRANNEVICLSFI